MVVLLQSLLIFYIFRGIIVKRDGYKCKLFTFNVWKMYYFHSVLCLSYKLIYFPNSLRGIDTSAILFYWEQSYLHTAVPSTQFVWLLSEDFQYDRWTKPTFPPLSHSNTLGINRRVMFVCVLKWSFIYHSILGDKLNSYPEKGKERTKQPRESGWASEPQTETAICSRTSSCVDTEEEPGDFTARLQLCFQVAPVEHDD